MNVLRKGRDLFMNCVYLFFSFFSLSRNLFSEVPLEVERKVHFSLLCTLSLVRWGRDVVLL
jgi:hypothetical protein